MPSEGNVAAACARHLAGAGVTIRAPVTLNLLSHFDLRANDEAFALRPTDPAVES